MSVRCALLQAAIGEVFPEATISVLLSSDVLDCYTWAEYSPTLDEVAMQQRVGLAHCMSSLKEEGALLKVCVCVLCFATLRQELKRGSKHQQVVGTDGICRYEAAAKLGGEAMLRCAVMEGQVKVGIYQGQEMYFFPSVKFSNTDYCKKALDVNQKVDIDAASHQAMLAENLGYNAGGENVDSKALAKAIAGPSFAVGHVQLATPISATCLRDTGLSSTALRAQTLRQGNHWGTRPTRLSLHPSAKRVVCAFAQGKARPWPS